MKNETIVRLTESQLNAAIGKTITEHIKKEKETLNENWLADASIQFGDFVYTHAPQFFTSVLKLKNEYAQGIDYNDPTALQLAKKVVGGLLLIPIGVAGFFGGVIGGYKFFEKYKPQIEKLKVAFFSKFATK